MKLTKITYEKLHAELEAAKARVAELEAELAKPEAELAKTELLPCKLCGSEPRRSPQPACYWYCQNEGCGAFGPNDDPDGAKWNRLMGAGPVVELSWGEKVNLSVVVNELRKSGSFGLRDNMVTTGILYRIHDSMCKGDA